MITKRTILITCFLLVCRLALSQPQEVSDSLLQKSFDYLESQFWTNSDDRELALPYAQAFLIKAKLKKNDSITQTGYFYNSYISEFESALAYCDSIISISKDKLVQGRTALVAYNERGYLYYSNSHYKEALENYLIARRIAKEQKDNQIYFMSNYSIGVIKSLIGQEEEALTIFKEQYKNFRSDSLKSEFPEVYLSSLVSLADSYITIKKLDSATYYNDLGVRESLLYESKEHYPIFVLNEGINLYEKKEYSKASDSLSKATTLFQKNGDSLYLALGYLNKAKVLVKSKASSNAILLLKKADTIISKIETILPEYSPVYELLYESFKKTDSVESQLVYLEKLINYNKKLEEKFDGIDLAIYRQYDTPVLIESKEKIINELEHKNRANKRNIYLLSVFLAALSILSFYYYRKRIVYKKRYHSLIRLGLNTKQKLDVQVENRSTSKIPSDILDQLLPKISEFELEKGFLDNSMTLNKMAKLLGSNSNYLSKTINHVKGKNFSLYLSDMRIEYALQELKTNPILLNYTIKAIATEVGFGNSESFTKAFYGKTNLYPSYFIKQLKKERTLTQNS